MSESTVSNLVGVPNEFVGVDQWICWRKEKHDGKPTKIPVTPGTGTFASSTNPETWTDFEIALEYVRSDEADGLGFVFTDDDPFVGIDLDDCRDPETGSVDDDARGIVNQPNSYTGVSPSGTEFHVLIKGALPDGWNRKGSVEIYDSARFFTMTGDRVDVKPQTVEVRQDTLTEVHREYVHEPSMAGGVATTETNSTSTTPTVDVDLDDEELIEKAQNAANGEKFNDLHFSWTPTLVIDMGRTDSDREVGDSVTSGNQPDIDDVFEELEELAEMVDSPDEREQVIETMQTLRRSRSSSLVGRLQDTFDSRDVGEAFVGSFVFGIPMVVESGTLEIGEYIASHPALLLLTLAFGGVLVYGILHAVEFERIREDVVFGIVSIRLVTIPLIASTMGFGLMTIWGRADWTTPMIATGQCIVTSIVMAVGASLGDVLPGT